MVFSWYVDIIFVLKTTQHIVNKQYITSNCHTYTILNPTVSYILKYLHINQYFHILKCPLFLTQIRGSFCITYDFLILWIYYSCTYFYSFIIRKGKKVFFEPGWFLVQFLHWSLGLTAGINSQPPCRKRGEESTPLLLPWCTLVF